MQKPTVAVLKTTPATVFEDIGRLMRSVGYRDLLDPGTDLLLKLNLSWTRYFPACSSQPWQLEGVLRTLLEDGYDRDRVRAIENKTVVTEPWKGARNNRWLPVLEAYGVPFTPLTEVKWTVHRFREPLIRLHEIFPDGIEIPEMFAGRNILHLPTVKTHGHSITTGAVKNAFGGLLKEVRHYCHKYIHEVLADLMIMQRELHPGVFTVMDGTVCGDGAGPRTMHPVCHGYLLASADSVAIDAVAARMMGFDPLQIGYLRICHDRGLGVADPADIRIVGENVDDVNFGFHVQRSLVIWGDQLLRLGPLRFLEKIALHSPLVVWAPIASNIYHDWMWYPTVGKARIRRFQRTAWGELFRERYLHGAAGLAQAAAHLTRPWSGR